MTTPRHIVDSLLDDEPFTIIDSLLGDDEDDPKAFLASVSPETFAVDIIQDYVGRALNLDPNAASLYRDRHKLNAEMIERLEELTGRTALPGLDSFLLSKIPSPWNVEPSRKVTRAFAQHILACFRAGSKQNKKIKRS